MDTAVENALRSQARRCRQEIIAQTQGKPKKQHDPITTAILDSHAKKNHRTTTGEIQRKTVAELLRASH